MNMYMTHGRWERGGLEQRQGRAALVRDSKHAVLVVQVPLVPVGVQTDVFGFAHRCRQTDVFGFTFACL